MNKTKKILIIFSIIFSFVNIAWEIAQIVLYFLQEPQNRNSLFYLIYDFVTIAVDVAIAVLLILAICKNGQYFRLRYGMYVTAFMLSIVFNLFSLSTIFLIASMFTSNWVWVNEDKGLSSQSNEKKETGADETLSEKRESDDKKRQQIASLRALKDSGAISEEEFQKRLMELL